MEVRDSESTLVCCLPRYRIPNRNEGILPTTSIKGNSACKRWKRSKVLICKAEWRCCDLQALNHTVTKEAAMSTRVQWRCFMHCHEVVYTLSGCSRQLDAFYVFVFGRTDELSVKKLVLQLALKVLLANERLTSSIVFSHTSLSTCGSPELDAWPWGHSHEANWLCVQEDDSSNIGGTNLLGSILVTGISPVRLAPFLISSTTPMSGKLTFFQHFFEQEDPLVFDDFRNQWIHFVFQLDHISC